MRPSRDDVLKIWDWTQNDCHNLFKGFYVELKPGIAGSGPSSGFAIYLFSAIDTWGSIIRDKFGERSGTSENVAEILNRLKNKYPNLYDYGSHKVTNVSDDLRNNLSHNYGLRVLKTDVKREWLNIDVNSVGNIINEQENDRWHIDCMRLRDHFLIIVAEWLKENNYIDD